MPAQDGEASSLIVEMTVAVGMVLFSFYVGYFLLMSWKAKGNRPLHSVDQKYYTPYVSVILPTYNEEDTILFKLKNLEKQGYPNMEIIVVDGSSSDKTVELIRKFAERSSLDVRLIEEKEREGKACALNKAFKLCSGEIVVMTDSDAVWEGDALRKAISNFSDPNVGAVTGRQVLLNPCQSLATKVENSYRNIYEVLRVGESAMDSTPIFHGEISCYRRNLIDGVSEDSMADDSELAVKTRKKGFRSIYDPEVVFYEHAPPTFRSRLIQKLRRGQGLIQLFLRERKILFNHSYEHFGLIVFPAEFFMHTISPIIVFAFLPFFVYSLYLIDINLVIALGSALPVFLAISTVSKKCVLSLPLSFLNSQFILLLSLIFQMFGRSQHKWAKVTEIRQLWRERNRQSIYARE